MSEVRGPNKLVLIAQINFAAFLFFYQNLHRALRVLDKMAVVVSASFAFFFFQKCKKPISWCELADRVLVEIDLSNRVRKFAFEPDFDRSKKILRRLYQQNVIVRTKKTTVYKDDLNRSVLVNQIKCCNS